MGNLVIIFMNNALWYLLMHYRWLEEEQCFYCFYFTRRNCLQTISAGILGQSADFLPLVIVFKGGNDDYDDDDDGEGPNERTAGAVA